MSKAAKSFSKAVRDAVDRVQLGVEFEDAEEQVPEDDGAEVLLIHVDGGKQLLVTIEECGS